MENLTDTELVKRAREGDSGSFSILVDRHYQTVFKYAYRWCNTREDAEDITHDVFIRLAGKIHLFENRSLFTSWLYRITANCAKDLLRKNKRWARNILSDPATSESIVNANPGPEKNLMYRSLRTMIANLPEKLKEAVLLVYGEGMNHKEAAKIIGCAETTVSWRIFKAKRQLRKVMS